MVDEGVVALFAAYSYNRLLLSITLIIIISLLPLPSISSISLYTISYRTVERLSIKHVRMDMRVPYGYC